MIQFTDDCLIGIEQIDDEHRHLFDLLGKADTLLADDFNEDCYEELKGIITELESYAENHFAHEEAYMLEIKDPELIRQRAQHDYFREKLQDYEFVNLDSPEEQQRVLSDLVEFLARWLYRHILSSDMMIGKMPPLEEWMLRENPCEFTDDYLVGIELIDNEHRELFKIVDKASHLIKNLDDASGYDKIVDILNQLRDYTKEHFSDEEEYMEGIGYEGLEAQKRAHDAFIERLNDIDLDRLDENPKESLQELLEFLLGWLVNHILYTDKKIPAAQGK